jgi:glycosyltransferase involved in cell wall biosynthesis
MMLGFRGFPGVQGGVESHVENLCPLLRELGCDVEAIVRSRYMPPTRGAEWRGVRYRRVWSPRSKTLEAIVHTLLGVLLAAWTRPDVLHFQAIGSAFWTPLARLFGLRVVFTHHSQNYEWQKWGRIARTVLRLNERLAMRFSNGRIAISEGLRELMQRRYGVEVVRIPNGVLLPMVPDTRVALRLFGLEAGHYFLHVGRLTPEKCHEDLIQAFRIAAVPGWKLAIVGAADSADAYARHVHDLAARTPGVIMTGFQTGSSLAELFAHAGVFVLPSAHEGLPMALLEAMSYGLPVLASDIAANREIGLGEGQYFVQGDSGMLAACMRQAAATPATRVKHEATRSWIAARYSWPAAARATLAVYRSVLAD